MTRLEISTEQAGKMSELGELGFTRLFNSNIMQNGGAYLDVAKDGSHELMVDFDNIGLTNWSEITGVKVGGLSFKGFVLVLGNAKGEVNERSLNGSGVSYDEAKRFTKERRGIPIEQQLKDSGFEQVDIGGNVFRVHVEEDRLRGDLVALVENGKILIMLKPVDERVRKHMGTDFKIISTREEKERFGDDTNTVLTVEKGPMQFDVTTEYGGRLLDGTQKLLRSISASELGIQPVEKIVEQSGFTVGGSNDSELILGLNSLAGQSISQLELVMRPMHSSMSGFLGEHESLREVLAEDNDFVLSQGLTHQELAAPLFYARQHVYGGYGNEFTYEGAKYKVEMMNYRGYQDSPFMDGTKTMSDMTITNLDSGDSLSCSALIPDMMARYGFYEGKGTPYRLEPSAVIKVFGLGRNGQ